MRGETPIRLLEPAGPVDAVFEDLFRGRPAVVIGRATRGLPRPHRRGQPVEPMGTAAGGREDVGIGLHLHHPFGRPGRAVAGLPGGVGRQECGERHQRPGRLLTRTDVVLRLGEQVGDGEVAIRDHKPSVERNAARAPRRADAAVGEIAEPLVGMPLAHRAALLDDRHDAGLARTKLPTGEAAAREQVVEGRAGLPVMHEGKLGPEGEDPVHHLPGAVHVGVEPACIAGVGEHGVDPATEAGDIDGSRLGRCGRRGPRAATASR